MPGRLWQGTLNLAVGLFRIAVALSVLSLSGTALAEGPQTAKPELPRVANAGAFVRDTNAIGGGHRQVRRQASKAAAASELPAALCLPPGAELPSEAEDAPEATPAPKKKRSVSHCGPEGCGYKALLGHLVITRDLELPGSSGVAVRLLPTSHALAGDSHSRFVVRPRVQGAYGVHLAARF